MTTLYTAHSVLVQPDGMGAPVLIGGITQLDGDTQTEINAEETAGSPYAQNTNIKSQKPMASFSTRDIAKAIDTFGFIGLTIQGTTNPGVEIWQALIENGVVKAGNFHKKTTIKTGRAIIRKISVSHQEDAQADCEVMSIYDGTNAPMIPSASSLALPGTPADPARYTLHSLTFGGVAINKLQNIDIDFGMNLESLGGDSDVWDTQLLISKLQPIITFRSGDLSKFLTASGVPLLGLNGTHANTIIKLRKRATGSVPFVADGTAEHITITTAGIVNFEKVITASQNKRGEQSYRITTRFDGTNVPLIFDTTATLSA